MEAGKNDKPRSIRIAAKKGISGATSTKAKVLNKIVREASGVHNYALVPPIRKKGMEEAIPIDPETHPVMQPYREQSNRNPVMVSFGHRPRSASRTFHPSTMRIRLGHGEIADTSSAEGKNGIGLPPSVLAQILHAPRVPRPGEELEELEANGGDVEEDRPDPHGLFLSKDELFGKACSAPARDTRGGAEGEIGRSGTWQEGLAVGEDGFGQSRTIRRRKKTAQVCASCTACI